VSQLTPAPGKAGDPRVAAAPVAGGPQAGRVASQRRRSTAVSRKIVTIVFADLIGSVSLHERLDAESARRLMDRYHRAMSAAVDVHGGRVVQPLGDGVLAAFGVPRVAEDDAIRAVRAAVGMQRAFRELAREQSAAMGNVGLRVAVNTGEIVVSDDQNSVMGDPTNVAARLQQEARDGDVIVGEGTQRLVRDLVTLAPLGSVALRGRAESVVAYRVVSLDRPASQQATAFVGRDEELRRLVAVYEAAVAAPAARLAVLLGSPGLGKSRLVAEGAVVASANAVLSRRPRRACPCYKGAWKRRRAVPSAATRTGAPPNSAVTVPSRSPPPSPASPAGRPIPAAGASATSAGARSTPRAGKPARRRRARATSPTLWPAAATSFSASSARAPRSACTSPATRAWVARSRSRSSRARGSISCACGARPRRWEDLAITRTS
jgi:class 3 adenylate cyclase